MNWVIWNEGGMTCRNFAISERLGKKCLVMGAFGDCSYSDCHSLSVASRAVRLTYERGNTLWAQAVLFMAASLAAPSAILLPTIPTWALVQVNWTVRPRSESPRSNLWIFTTCWSVLLRSCSCERGQAVTVYAGLMALCKACNSEIKTDDVRPNLNFLMRVGVLASITAKEEPDLPVSNLLPSV